MADGFIQDRSSDPWGEVCDREGALVRIVHCFYGKVRKDALLGPVFDRFIGDQWEEHLRRMCDFWSSVLFQTGRYKGNPMLAHLRIDEIGARHFDRWMDLFVETVGEECDGPLAVDLISRAARMRENLQQAVMQAAGRQYSAV